MAAKKYDNFKKYKGTELSFGYENRELDVLYYVGKTSDIKALYKSIFRAYERECTDIFPLFTERAIFSDYRSFYALSIREDGQMTVLNSDTFLGLLLDGGLTPIE